VNKYKGNSWLWRCSIFFQLFPDLIYDDDLLPLSPALNSFNVLHRKLLDDLNFFSQTFAKEWSVLKKSLPITVDNLLNLFLFYKSCYVRRCL
jgi:hypothetical protein